MDRTTYNNSILSDRPSVEKIEVIRTTLQAIGSGQKGNPARRIIQYWSLEGQLLAEVDPWDIFS